MPAAIGAEFGRELLRHRGPGIREEPFDVMLAPTRKNATLLSFKGDDIKHMVRFS
ncbi:hypothetical protein HRUBRA_00180 [Pseudohaliea rubra DSM 19751]|uniref:Uncharacterized protein n=1 Tax=Pseudohaliea rubra DSM 19751 TaxID=1265313 RepID=A0A095VV55_9GAMM|nr:hypothetical protein HRUBRA_00180 [Pseudohaliea rubra DSM 19751]